MITIITVENRALARIIANNLRNEYTTEFEISINTTVDMYGVNCMTTVSKLDEASMKGFADGIERVLSHLFEEAENV